MVSLPKLITINGKNGLSLALVPNMVFISHLLDELVTEIDGMKFSVYKLFPSFCIFFLTIQILVIIEHW